MSGIKGDCMKRIMLVMEYLGTDFSGFQAQPNKRTVQGEVEKVLSEILNQEIKIYASGRTDAGVHSLGQVAHFDIECEVDVKRLHYELVNRLPQDISVSKVDEVSLDFDSRFSVKKKTYVYKFYLSRYERAVFRGRALRVNDNVDVNKMAEACKYLVGTHDFKSFVTKKSGKTDFVRTIYSAKITAREEGIYEFEVCGNGFLYNMVRIIMGTLIDIGSGRKKPEELKNIIDGKARAMAGKTVLPYGLYMKKVEY